MVWRWLRRNGEPEDLGRRGEDLAARHLRKTGYRILRRNQRSRLGEIDIIALSPDRQFLVIVEVKAGRPGPYPPELHVTPAKQRKLTALGANLLRRHRTPTRRVRFDVIAVVVPEDGEPTLRHHCGAFASHV